MRTFAAEEMQIAKQVCVEIVEGWHRESMQHYRFPHRKITVISCCPFRLFH